MKRLVAILCALGCTMLMQANPRVVSFPGRAHLSSERLLIGLSAEEAIVSGSFTFRFEPDDPGPLREWRMALQVPIWMPAESEHDPTVTSFWRAFGDGLFAGGITDDNRDPFEAAVRFSALLNDRPLRAEPHIAYSRHTNPAAVRWNWYWLQDQAEFQTFEADGIGCLIVQLGMDCSALLNETPVAVNYRQPLAKISDGWLFVYLPVFREFPSRLTTTDLDHFSITLVADTNVILNVTNGPHSPVQVVGPGQRLVLSPAHLQPIRAVIQRSNQAVEATQLRLDVSNDQ
jgi:hypothetical protein